MNTLKALFKLAESQDGYFSVKQANDAGISRQALHYQKREDQLRSVCRGIYHIVGLPVSPNEELIAVWLSSDQMAVISHETALSLHQLSDALPSRASIILPTAWKKRRLFLPFNPIVYYGEVPQQEQEWLGCLPVTKPLRTISDCQAAGTPENLLSQARVQARTRGLIKTPSMPFQKEPLKEPGELSSRGLDKVLDEVRCPCCPPRHAESLPHHFVRGYKLPFYSKQTVSLLRKLQWDMMRSKSSILQSISEPSPQKHLSPQIVEGEGGSTTLFEPITLVNDFTIAKDDVLAGNFGALTRAVQARADDEGEKLEQWVMDNVRRSAAAVGNIVAGSGRVSHEAILDALEKVEVSFLPTGEIRDLALYVNPNDALKLRQQPMTHEQQARFEAIMRKKWEDWSARQSRRRVR
jgi:hypothetical protein